MFRREVYWDSECPVSMLDLKAIDKPMEKLKDVLAVNFGLNIAGTSPHD